MDACVEVEPRNISKPNKQDKETKPGAQANDPCGIELMREDLSGARGWGAAPPVFFLHDRALTDHGNTDRPRPHYLQLPVLPYERIQCVRVAR